MRRRLPNKNQCPALGSALYPCNCNAMRDSDVSQSHLYPAAFGAGVIIGELGGAIVLWRVASTLLKGADVPSVDAFSGDVHEAVKHELMAGVAGCRGIPVTCWRFRLGIFCQRDESQWMCIL